MELVALSVSYLIGMTLLHIGCEAVFLSFPRNEIVQVSKNVELQCITNSSEPLRWEFANASEPPMKTVILFTRGNFTDVGKTKYGINSSISGQFNLIIESVDFSYAGKYRCTEGSFGPKVEAELAVINPYPQCQTNASDTDNSIVENEYLWMQCRVGFSGHVNLRMEWIRSSTGSVIGNTVENSNQSLIVIQVNSSDNGETFIFKATFTQENNSRETVIEWNLTVNVLYAPRNLVINSVGDCLECSADGNPTPSYEWIDFATNKITSGSILCVDEYMKSDQNKSFNCSACNTVACLRRHIFETNTLSVKDLASATPDTIGLTVTLLLIFLVTIFCFIPVIGYVFYRVYNKRKLNHEEASVERQHRSGFDCELMEPTITANQKPQNRKITDRTVGNEGNYTELKDRSFGVQHPELYSPLHIYANSSVNPDYANLG